MKLEAKLPPPDDREGTVPVTVASVSARAPTAPVTSCWRAIVPTDEPLSVPYSLLARLFRSILVPAAIWPLRTCWMSCRKPNTVAALWPWAGAWVTVRSVPTPYSECSTVACASCTPAEAAATVMTNPTPRASPSAITMAWRLRRRSSRRR